LSQNVAEKLFHTFVTARLDYCNSLLSGCSNKSLRSLPLIQNAAARVLTKTKKIHHITPVIAALHWLPVTSRITFIIHLLTYKALIGDAPSYLKEFVVPYCPTLLVVPSVLKTRMGARAFSFEAPLLWNQPELNIVKVV